MDFGYYWHAEYPYVNLTCQATLVPLKLPPPPTHTIEQHTHSLGEYLVLTVSGMHCLRAGILIAHVTCDIMSDLLWLCAEGACASDEHITKEKLLSSACRTFAIEGTWIKQVSGVQQSCSYLATVCLLDRGNPCLCFMLEVTEPE